MVKIGSIVEFVDKVFEPPFYPYYEAYKGHKFKVDHIHHGDHLALSCITGDVLVKGYVHDFDVRVVSVNKLKKQKDETNVLAAD